MKRTMFLALVLAVAAAGAAHAQAPVADYYSTSSKLDGAAMPPGTTIEAYDGDGVRCGYAVANPGGHFLMHVYGNDPMTPSIDEGAREGEILSWRVNGLDVAESQVAWIANLVGLFADLRFENGAAKEMQLDMQTTAVEDVDWSDVKERYRP